MTYIKNKSKKQEGRVAKDLGGKLTPASGALDGAKGDVRLDKFLIECKYTDNNYYIFNTKIWDKIAEEALKDGIRLPLMQIDIQDRKYILVDYYLVEDFIKGKSNEFLITNKSFKFYPKNYGECDYLVFIIHNSNKIFDTPLVLMDYYDFQKILDELWL